MASILLSQVLTLSALHLITVLALAVIGWGLLPPPQRRPHAVLLILMWAWSVAALFNFYLQDRGFFSWFLDPSAEQNLPAMLNTTLLMTLGLFCLSLMRRFMQDRRWIDGLYWFLLAFLFIFLALDEYFSLHEGIVFWRTGYLALGGTIALFTLAQIIRAAGATRPLLLLFLVGLGVMGISGVVLDAFSTYSVIEIGPIELDFLRCRSTFLGVVCRDFANSEELFELCGAVTMLISVLSIWLLQARQQPFTYSVRLLLGMGLLWGGFIVSWLWVLPSIEARLAPTTRVIYDDLTLLSTRVSADTVQAGETITVTVYAAANRPLQTDYSLSLHFYSKPEVVSIAQDDMTLGNFTYPTRAWIPGLAVRNSFELTVPDDLPQNASYDVVAILWQEAVANRRAVVESTLPTLSETIVVLDSIAAPDNGAAPADLGYTFAETITLDAVELPQVARVGEALSVDFWWTSSAAQSVNVTHFLHWFHEETGEFVIFDQIPFAGQFPVQDWEAAMTVRDRWIVTLPDDMAAGSYRLQTGLFQVEDGLRLPVVDAEGKRIMDDSVMVGTVRVE